MPDDNNQNNEQQQTGAKQVVIGCDHNNSQDQEYEDIVGQIIEQGGYSVEKLPIGPNEFATYSYDSSRAKGKIGVYIIAVGLTSICDLYDGNTSFDYAYFGIRGGLNGIDTAEEFQTHAVHVDKHGDCITPSCSTFNGKTYPEINAITQSKCQAVFGATPEEMGNNILAAMGGQPMGGAVQSTTGAAAVLIQNVTFYGLIKQIIGAIDGVFIIANNMAYLLSFQDMYKYRDKFEDNIPMIEPKYILHDSYTKQWSPVGCYNSVEVEYADGIIKYQNDALVKQYGENTFHYEFSNDDEETARDKASALLSAHIRDYSSDIHMSIFYNENITVGSWVKLPKTVTQIKGRTRQERAQELQKDKKITRKGVNITNITEELVKQSDNSYKKIQHLTDEKGEKTDIELQNKDYDLFFVQGFTCKWNKKHSLMMDIHLKYGPDTPEDPINATISVGQVSSSGGAVNTGGSWGDDCFSICDICFEDCRKVLGYGGGRRQDAEEYIRTHEADSKYLAGRAKQGSSYANEVAGKTPQEAYTLFRTKFNYACYSDSCDSAYPCCEDLWDKATAANCGDSTRMLKVLMDATGTPCYGVHVDGHYFNAVQVDGTWHTLDGTRGPTNSSCNFPDSGNYGSGSNSCGSGWC